MLKNIDLYLGVFLILCGFIISLINLNSVKSRKYKYSSVLLSENIIIVCIGIAFISRAVYSLHPENVDMEDIMRMADKSRHDREIGKCGITALLLGYGPFIVSMVNSFLSLIIDNYMHYQIITDMKKKDEENNVHAMTLNSSEERSINMNKIFLFFKKKFSLITIILQWLIPILIALSMLSMDVKGITVSEARNFEKTCMTMLDMSMEKCLQDFNYTLSTNRKPVPPLKVYELGQINSTLQIDSILDNVLNIVRNYANNSEFRYTSLKSSRKPKLNEQCLEICITNNKHMLVYMFLIMFLGYFVPITISVIILTKISFMNVKKPYFHTYVSRELLYNVLFWTPVMFDTFVSLMLCSYSMQGLRTSVFHVIANVYQAIKNFINTRFFKENLVVPV